MSRLFLGLTLLNIGAITVGPRKLQEVNLWQWFLVRINRLEIDSSVNDIKNKWESSLELKHFFENQKLYLSLHHSTNSYYYFLSTSCSQNDIEYILANDSLIGSYEMREYDGILIYKLSNNLNLCYHNNILFVCNEVTHAKVFI
ncbi:hypothetical protein N9Y89_02150 [bacterium]|nr:hypothetical protein [bacterium]